MERAQGELLVGAGILLKWFDNDLARASLKAFGVAVILTPILRDVFRSYNIVDHPGQRKMHAHPIPRIGGIPIAVAYGVAMLSLVGASPALDMALWKLLPGAGLVFLTGLMDDLFNLRPVVKLGGQVAAALLVFFSGLRLDLLGKTNIPWWIDLPLTVFWLLLTTNAFNLIDGLDGLCAGVGLLATLTLFGAALLHDNQPLVYATLPVACALVGFLCYNLNPATVFLGDSGALLIGFLLGCYGMIWAQKTTTLVSIFVPLIALSLPLLDLLLAVLRRALRRQSIFSADRRHIHHRLLDSGLSPGRAVIVLYSIGAIAAALGVLLSTALVAPFQNVLLVVILSGIWLGLRKLRYWELDVMGWMGGRVQHNLQATLRMEHLAGLLRGARSPDEWWEALLKGIEDFGWTRIRWEGPQGVRETHAGTASAGWSFRIPLKQHGFVEVEGIVRNGHKPSAEQAALTEILADSVATASRSWNKQKSAID